MSGDWPSSLAWGLVQPSACIAPARAWQAAPYSLQGKRWLKGWPQGRLGLLERLERLLRLLRVCLGLLLVVELLLLVVLEQRHGPA